MEFIKKLKEEEHLLEEIVMSNMDIVCFKDADGNWIEVNGLAQKLLKIDKFHLLGKKNHEMETLFPDIKDFFVNSRVTDEQTWKSRKMTQFERQFNDSKGELKTLEIIKIPFFQQDGSREALLVLGKDITLEKYNTQKLSNLIKELADFKFALDQSSIVATTDYRGRITYVNDKFCEISKYSMEELIGNDHHILNSGYHPKSFFRDMWKTIRQGDVWTGEIKNQAKDGSFYWVKTTLIPFVNEKGIPYQYIAIRQDITEQKEFGEQILHNSYHDDLTGLRNRRCFRNEIGQWISKNKETNQMALIFLDLNRFKYINDTLGHNVGDQILRNVSKRLFTHLHEKADLYRFGGDEFIIVLKNQSKADVVQFVEEIISLFLSPFHLYQERLYLAASLGVSLFPKDGQDVETLVKKADSAMYVAKRKGNNAVQFYTVDMSEQMKKKLKIESELRHAIEEEEFVLYYQPQVDLTSNRITGVEALIRWVHPTLGMIPPSEFISLAEETGLITPITKWVLETACTQNRKWQESGVCNLRMGVNISSSLFKEDLVGMVTGILKKTQLQPGCLDLEITESIMQNPDISIPILKNLKSLGVHLSIDDFGTGYSSLAYLRDFPIDRLKIDRSFIEEIQTDNGAIIKMIINMASHLNVSVIAEGIETKNQLYFLSQLYCDEGQGYLFSRPLPATELYKLLLEQKRIDKDLFITI